MITKEQIDTLAKFYQIDRFTIIREYLQLTLLSYLYQKKEGKKFFFKGGTAIRLLFGSPRFSEDLDFSTTYGKKKIRDIVKEIEKSMKQEILEVKILTLYSGKKTERFRIKYEGRETKYPQVVRLDFHRVKKIGKTAISPLLTKFPIALFPLVSHLTEEEILKEKLQALAARAKGRDFFDVWYLRKKGCFIKKKINKRLILKKIETTPQGRLTRELVKFLPKPQRPVIGLLKKELIGYFENS